MAFLNRRRTAGVPVGLAGDVGVAEGAVGCKSEAWQKQHREQGVEEQKQHRGCLLARKKRLFLVHRVSRPLP